MLKIDVFHLATFPQDSYEYLMTEIPKEEQQYVRRYKNKEDRIRGLVARLLLKEAIEEHGGQELIEIKRRHGNKPYVEDWLPFSISHSGDYVVLAYSDTLIDLGVDIEEIKEIQINEIVDFFHSEERNHLNQSVKSKVSFYEIWTRKEAVLKAAGVGIVEGLDTFSCLKSPIVFKDKKYSAIALNINPDYAASVAAPSQSIPCPEIKIKHRFNCERIEV